MDIKFHNIAGSFLITAKVRINNKVSYYFVSACRSKNEAIDKLFKLIQ